VFRRSVLIVHDILNTFLRTLRVLARAPAFSVTVLLTLGLTLGLNTAVFSAIDAIVFEPLPFPSADRLVRVWQTQPDSAETNIAPVRVQDWQRLSTTFEGITGYSTADESDLTGVVPERTRRASVSPGFLDVWGVAPAQGRGFVEDEHRYGGPPAALISDRYWRTRLGATPDVLTRSLRIGDRTLAIVGVMPASFVFPDRSVDLWVPADIDGPLAPLRNLTWYIGIGRLRNGVTLEEARADLALVQSRLAAEYPATDAAISAQMEPLKGAMIGSVADSLWLLFGAVTLLLLVACTNVASLFLARSTRRQSEIAIRQSLGASRAAIVGQIVAEAAVLVLASAALGALIAAAAPAVLGALVPSWPRVESVGLDLGTFAYVAVAAAFVAGTCGALPALRATRVGAALSATRVLGGARTRFQWSLVGIQVALSVVLLAGAALLVQSSVALSRVDAGFDPARVLMFRLSGDYAETGDRVQFSQRIAGNVEALRGVVGVDQVATTAFVPGVGTDFSTDFSFIDAGIVAERGQLAAQMRTASPSYFDAIGVPLVAGEVCRDAVAGSAAREFMVNRSFADRYLAGRSAAGLGLRVGGGAPATGTIAGVVGDVRELGLDRTPVPTIYRCQGASSPFAWFVVRTRGEPSAAIGAIRARLAEVEPARAIYDAAPLQDHVGAAYRTNNVRTLLLGVFAIAALALACVGLYGTLSYVVSLRRREVGLRMALGARRRGVVTAFVSLALRVVAAAAVVGAVVFLAAVRSLGGTLYGVSPWDPLTLASVMAATIVIAALAAALPALRASRVDPMTVLREE
jgi:putative ABC transport system permease protein